MKRTKKFIMWALTIFMLVSSIVFAPSIASVIMLAFVIVAAPIDSWQEVLSGVGIRGWMKGIVLCVAFVGAMMTVPAKDTTRTADFPDGQPSHYGTLPSRAPTQTDLPASSEVGTDILAPTQAPSERVSAEPDFAQSQVPNPTGAPVSTPSKAPTPTEAQAAQNSEPSVSLAPTAPPVRQTQAPAQSGNQGGGGQGNADNFNIWDNQDQQNTSAKWVLNTSTRKIHYPNCSEVRRIAPHNYKTSNESEAELIAQGYTTCGRCH